MLSSPIIDLAIGLTFVFGVTAALASLVTELISRFLGLRGAYLLTGLRELVDDGKLTTDLGTVKTQYTHVQNLVRGTPASAGGAAPAGGPAPEEPSVTAALLGGPILGSQGVVGEVGTRALTLQPTTEDGRLSKITLNPASAHKWYQFGRKQSELRSLPSYISSRSFGEAVIDLVVPDARGHTTMDDIEANIKQLPDTMPFKSSLQALVKTADGDVGRFRTAVEKWYDDHMDRVSGWYKRRVGKITLAFGALIVILLNLNALTIGRTLYTDSAVSTAVSAVAAKTPACATSSTSSTSSSSSGNANCLASVENELSAAASAGLPVGWGTVRDCLPQSTQSTQSTHSITCNWLDQRGIFSPYGDSFAQLVLVLAGFLIMIIAILPGAQFWFGLLTKLNTLRSTGPKPAT